MATENSDITNIYNKINKKTEFGFFFYSISYEVIKIQILIVTEKRNLKCLGISCHQVGYFPRCKFLASFMS